MSDWPYPVTVSSEVGAHEVLDLLHRQRWTVILTLVVFIILGAMLTARMTPTYRAGATMLIQQKAGVHLAGNAEGDPLTSLLEGAQPHPADTQVEVMESGALLRQALQQIGPFAPEAIPSINVSQIRETDILEVVAESTDPRVARDAANQLIKVYIDKNEEASSHVIRRTRQFVEANLKQAEASLFAVEARLRDYQEAHGLPDLSDTRENAISEANRAREELQKDQGELVGLSSKMAQLREQIARQPLEKRTAETMIPNLAVSEAYSKIQNLNQQRLTLIRTLKPTEPEVQAIDEQIRQLKGELSRLPRTVRGSVTTAPNPLRETLEKELATLQTQYRGLQPQVALLKTQYQQAQARLASFPEWETRLTQLQRAREEAQEHQRALSSRLRELRIREQAQSVSAQVLSPATQPRSPIRPRPALNLLVAMALGLVAGVGLACLREMVDDRVHTVEEADQAINLPVLGRVPVFPRRSAGLFSIDGGSPVQDSYRRLRARVVGPIDTAVGTLMITSATPGEGKSTTAANLARAIALQGRKVILVDADLRDPSLAGLFEVASAPGLREALSEQLPVDSVLHPTSIPNLLLIPAGALGSDASELIASSRMKAILEDLKGLADLVILDTPPCLPVADAEVLGVWVDGTLLVVGLDRTNKADLRMARDLLDQAQVRLLGAVMNRVKAADRGYYSSYRGAPSGAATSPPPALQEASAAPSSAVSLPLEPKENEA